MQNVLPFIVSSRLFKCIFNLLLIRLDEAITSSGFQYLRNASVLKVVS